MDQLIRQLKQMHTVKVYQKNKSIWFFILMFVPTFTIIFLVFLAIYLLQEPMDINGVSTDFDSPIYQQFFLIFFLIFGVIHLVGLILVIRFFLQKPKLAFVKGTTLDYEPYYILFKRKSIEYYSKRHYFGYYLKTNHVERSQNSDFIQDQIDLILFEQVLNHKPTKIIEKPNRTILKYKTKQRGETTSTTYTFLYDLTGNVYSCKETVWKSAYGNSSLTSAKVYFFEEGPYPLSELPHPLRNAITLETN